MKSIAGMSGWVARQASDPQEEDSRDMVILELYRIDAAER